MIALRRLFCFSFCTLLMGCTAGDLISSGGGSSPQAWNFPGGAYITFSDPGVAVNLNSLNNFTVEMTVKISALPGGSYRILGTPFFYLDILSTGFVSFARRGACGAPSPTMISTLTVVSGQATHIAGVLSGGFLFACARGTCGSSTPGATFASCPSITGAPLGDPAGAISVVIDELRISNAARYTASSAYASPSTAFTVDANTLMLMHFDIAPAAGSVDSPTAVTFTPTGAIAVSPALF